MYCSMRRYPPVFSRSEQTVTVFIPARGLSSLSVPGAVFADAEADRALFSALKGALDPRTEVVWAPYIESAELRSAKGRNGGRDPGGFDRPALDGAARAALGRAHAVVGVNMTYTAIGGRLLITVTGTAVTLKEKGS